MRPERLYSLTRNLLASLATLDLHGLRKPAPSPHPDPTPAPRVERPHAPAHGMENALGVIGHELRTPLAGLRVLSELLLTDELPADQRLHFVRSIHDEVLRMTDMVNDMLEVARLGSGVARWNWKDFDAHTACLSAADAVRPLIDRTGVSLVLRGDGPPLAMRGDPDAVRRLLINLLANAHKYTTEGRITVTATRHSCGEEDYLQFVVCDTGAGIKPQAAARLGQAFALNTGMLGEGFSAGAGLGLAICKGIVQAHGGHITVDSTPGRGTTVTVRLRADLEAPARPDHDADCLKTSFHPEVRYAQRSGR